MPKTPRLLIASFALVVGVGLGILIATMLQLPSGTSVFAPLPLQDNERDFKVAMLAVMHRELPEPGGYTPEEFMTVFSELQASDFIGVSAVIGTYELKDGALIYTNTDITDAAAADVSEEGFRTLYNNLVARGAIAATSSDADSIMEQLSRSASTTDRSGDEPALSPVPPPQSAEACTKEAKVCPDGTSVGRTGPNCTFPACPDHEGPPIAIRCTPDQREADACIEIYAPVCAAYQVQCITTPCPPMPKTYPNSCFACMDNNVIGYSEGACAGDPVSE